MTLFTQIGLFVCFSVSLTNDIFTVCVYNIICCLCYHFNCHNVAHIDYSDIVSNFSLPYEVLNIICLTNFSTRVNSYKYNTQQ